MAETLSRAKNTSVDGLSQAGIVEARGGKVRLYRRDELNTDWNPATDKRLTAWEFAAHLIYALENGGEEFAAELLRNLAPPESLHGIWRIVSTPFVNAKAGHKNPRL